MNQGSDSPIPTDAELRILRVLWERGPSTVREVLDALSSEHDIGYTTVLKQLQIMAAKRMVERDDSARTHVYTAAVHRRPTEKRLVGELLDRVFEGSASKLVLRALSEDRATPAELEEIRRLIDRIEREGDSMDADPDVRDDR